MAKKITTCMLVPLIFVVSVIGLFFASTDPSTWPQKTTHLGAADTKLLSAASTIWCESIVLTSSEHDFMAYKLTDTPTINPYSMHRQVLELRTKLDRRRINKLERTFYLLTGSVIRIIVCATGKQAHLHVYKGTVTRECLDFTRQSSESDESDYEESWTVGYGDEHGDSRLPSMKFKCPPTLKSEDVPLTHKDYQSMDCLDSSTRAININVTATGNYAIILTNDGFGSNDVRLRLILDRVTYNVEDIKTSAHMCSTFTPCIVPLTFASKERILLTIPSEPDAGKNSYALRSQCRPRIAVFAFLIVFLPVVLFVIVAFIVRGGRKPSSRYHSTSRMDSVLDDSQWRNFVSPLLPDQSIARGSEIPRDHSMANPGEQSVRSSLCFDGDPPPYEIIFDDPPPSYSSLNPSLKQQEEA